MKKRLLYAAGMISLSFMLSAAGFCAEAPADTITLERLYGMVRSNHPALEKEGLIDRKSELSGRNLTFSWLPQFDLEGSGTFQSDVTSIDPELPPAMAADRFQFPSPARDQYRAELKVSQMIFDSGVTSARRELLRRDIAIEHKQVESEYYAIQKAVNNHFFAILKLKKEKAISESITDELRQQRGRVLSAKRHGAATGSAVNEIESRIIQGEQRIISIETELCSLYEAIGELTGTEIDTSAVLLIPEYSPSLSSDNRSFRDRPDIQALEMRMKRIRTAEKLTFRENLPRIFGFATVGYGRPGLNMLSDEFDSYYMAGVTLSWNIFNWGRNRRERGILEVNRKILDKGRQSLIREISAELQRAIRAIEKYVRILDKDRRIVELRKKIASEKRSRFENGDITADDYISEMDRLEQARLNTEKDRIELQRARVKYLMIKGEL